MINIRRKLAAWRMRQSRGAMWLQFLINIGVITANIKLFQETIIYYTGITIDSMIYVYILAVVLYFMASFSIGYIDERYGIWQQENEYCTFTITPQMQDMHNKVTAIGKKVDRLIEVMEKK